VLFRGDLYCHHGFPLYIERDPAIFRQRPASRRVSGCAPKAWFWAKEQSSRRGAKVAPNSPLKDESDIVPWIEENVVAISAVPEIVDDLRTKRVTATLWIAMFGKTETLLPTIPADVVPKVKESGASLFLENYTIMDPEHGNPLKEWPTGAP
jgi:hypothetical protein